MTILLTGGSGYIGSHTAVVLVGKGHRVVLLDNLSNSHRKVTRNLEEITGTNIPFIECDVRDTVSVGRILKQHDIDAVIHFAGLKAVGVSVERPIDYYANNVHGTISLLQAMNSCGIRRLIFSSSAAVYGNPRYLPIDERHPTGATNPYGRSKLHIEQILHDVAGSDHTWRIVCLRYFNPIGAHDSGLIGERPNGTPNNLMPYIAGVAAGSLPHLDVFGNDYETNDGTGVRDYIHIMDLAEGHCAALDYLRTRMSGISVFNLGTGNGFSVLDMIKAFETASHRKIAYRFVPRRPGDVAVCYARAEKAAAQLGWKTTRTLPDMCASLWRFQTLSAGADSERDTERP
ncbi:MAG: UDP-glucose 4-epimerase [Candidatus Kentron sp. G]|nr:MAG: UDP-glucose 4-epimerase [Candidatus Kentron sp. G]VFN03032.1 MAG: UDP-glucose 4-epimerase [Candidatus Kentron sp. G]VFN04326.1 MAG: UDP-glucose 4-epimerase [Candidatus Kentron sp. G]